MYGRATGETSALDRKRQRPASWAVPRQAPAPASRRGDAPQRESPRLSAPRRISPGCRFMAWWRPEPGEMRDDVEW